MRKHEVLENMKNIVDNCLGDEKAACVATCPMHTDVKSYVKLIREDKGEEAIKVIREKLFIPGVLGRICAHPCEGKCKWNEAKNPISIASLKRYAADNFDKEENWDMTIKESNGKKVAVIGAGPAGLQAALDLRKEGCSVTVFEKLPVRGGMMAVGIPAYRLPRDIIEKEVNYLDKLGVEFKMNFEIGKDAKFSDIVNEFDSIVVAVGKHQGRVDRSLANFDAKGIFSAQGFLKEAALTSNIEDAGMKVLVVGGGDVAMDCCRTARRINGVNDVYSICLENSFDTMASSNHEIQGAKAEGIFFNHAKAIKTINVDSKGRVSSVVLKRCLSMFDAQGRFAPTFDADDTKMIEVDTIVFAIGQGVEGDFAKDILVQRPNSTFECDKQTLQSSSNEKVFVAGDASGESVIVIQAMATGRRVAQSVIRFLNGENLTEGRSLDDTWTFESKLKKPIDWSKFPETREDMKEVEVLERLKSFDEVALGYTKAEAKKEADRCKQCQCKGCMGECIMLNEYTDCPKTLFKEYLDKGIENMDEMIAYSCNECNQCTIVCPKKFDIKANFRFIKEDLAKKNKGLVPIKELQPSDAIQEKDCDDEYCTTVDAKSKEERVEMNNNMLKKKTKYVFVPGCTVPAYTPAGVENTLKHLRDSLGAENVGAMLQCCGKVTYLIGENEMYEVRNKKANDILDEMGAEVIITICPSCYADFSKTAKGKRVISYWDLMKNLIGVPNNARGIGEGSDVVFNIHDSCVTRDIISHHESVRWILDEMGYNWSEVERNGKDTRCCGVGGMVCSSKPKLYKAVYERRAKDFDSEHIVTYCGSCRGTMQAAGKDSIHILDLMFGDKAYMASDAKDRGYTTEEEMWANRLETKTRLENLK
ncbi:FAD-dependent oxidoreductase [uncultured Clostridium sp.]|jgi:NADPH-dependent glutamate synthase beta subunit-like oxidoreductase/sporulation protein YlmC with PRC-barrel domain|uniref:FAD-dependent oxidoreductase n=1 Tax=uncultured Clostridium sp. TaxID=59620 RepID=UPI002610143A|nr:FAD-dependent oxidoreductase [uncultured Clostridium sp.]